jgi:hypothetical protein
MAEKIAYQDPTAQILQMFTQLGGSKTSTSSTTSIDPAFLAQLQAVLGQQMQSITPEGMQALIGEVFKTGAKQAPVLATQLAQAQGARTSGNSPLAIGNATLQAELAAHATKLLQQAQVNAANTAGKLADAAPKTQSQSQTTKPRSTTMSLAPFLLANAGKLKGVAAGAKDFISGFGGSDTGFGSVPGGSGIPGFLGNNPSAYTFDTGSALGSAAPTFDVGADLAAFDFGSLSNLSEFAGTGTTVADVAAMDNFGSGFDFGNLDLGQFLVNGGKVQPVKKSPAAKPKGYADGGQVTQAINIGSGAIDIASGLQQGPQLNAAGMPDFTAETLGDDVVAYFASEASRDPNRFQQIDGQTFGSNYYKAKDGNTYYGVDRSNQQQANGGEGEYQGSPTTHIQQHRGSFVQGDKAWDSYAASNQFDKTYNLDGSFNDIAINAPTANPWLELAGFGATALSLGTAAVPAMAFATSMGTKAASGALGSALGKRPKAHIFGGVNKWKPGMANGGKIKGPGTPTSDSVPIMASVDEFIVPADTTNFFGPEFFETLVKLTHTPVAKQG